MSKGGAAAGPPQFLLHDEGDSVAVAVQDLQPGAVQGAVLANGRRCEFVIKDEVPLGHKFAVVELAEGADLVKYGIRVGTTTKQIAVGDYVHVHNVRSARWATSRAV
ncbi:UxaA family hydrolase [Saccharopolyspora phatthalungensis]|uniref:(2R)-sulfolactate sulfo-lyase subunit alpha n=1 Tax=Saccharopolyspora phatthalungensis TaxID=664693 RepID=A0A840QGJ2_9PSEU|nr:UxaA family hydrolase [Saccharopolyspora phatthalungensis]MBB5157655.1 (2R)-sulfolactate sulfo-lyase subunit alpha [Saccharopolyspora phatthalungensis]